MRTFPAREEGSVTIEMAFLVPLFLLLLWFGAEASYHYRLENKLHRATATLAELFANLPVEENEELPDLIRTRVAYANTLLKEMMGDT